MKRFSVSILALGVVLLSGCSSTSQNLSVNSEDDVKIKKALSKLIIANQNKISIDEQVIEYSKVKYEENN